MTDAPASTGGGERRVVSVLLPLPLSKPYDYGVPEGVNADAGAFVRVPLGPRRVVGVVWGDGAGDIAPEKLRDLEEVLDTPPMTGEARDFIDWVAGYTLAARGSVLRMAMSVPAAFDPPRPSAVVVRGDAAPERLTPQREKVLAEVDTAQPRPQAALARAAGVGSGVVRGLIDAGVLRLIAQTIETKWSVPDTALQGPVLSAAQAAAASALVKDVEAGHFAASLLDGVTGAGKTEVYLEAVAAALDAGKQALVLLPEIALGAQWLSRFEARFGVAPAMWNSDLTQGLRRDTWRAVAHGRARVVVGARSALFLPFADLGLIVVDEEHDASYKQEDGVIYNARDMAVVRARMGAMPVVLASATPALESVNNVALGRYHRLHLPERHGVAEIPDVTAIDMRAASPARGAWLSPPLVAALEATFAAGEQAMLFLNRRGYAPLTLCRACGHRLQCPNCTAWLVEHRLAGELRCHHCDLRQKVPDACPECDQTETLAACGPGIERLAEEVAARFPAARAGVMTSDTIHGPTAAARLVEAMLDHHLDVLIGTQMIAKGHHFPALTLVGVVDADLGLAGGDLRAAERTYQLLFQVAGRAGRAERPGRVLLQTYEPEHPVMQALVAGDRDGFVATELAAREAAGMPPFGRLAALVVSSADADAARGTAIALGRTAPRGDDIQVLGPAPAPLALIRGRHRFRLLVRAPREITLQPIMRRWLAAAGIPSGVRVQVDIDPYSFV
jgi:primosomal protein N' (replication factor Y)